jgi:hypothetical protein
MITTDIIIISYKDQVPLEKCIASIKKHCKDYNLIIEDNNVVNNGFTKAVNNGVRKGTAPYIWLVNSDALIRDKKTQQALIDRFSYCPQVGVVGSMQVDFDNHDLIRHAGTVRAFPGGIHKNGLISMGHGRVPEKQTWVNFASVMFSRSMYNDIGPLDESMFLIYSDSDYCYFARSKGYEVWYEPRSMVYHKLNASKTVTEWHKKDMEAFMEKWGIVPAPNGNFMYSALFSKLDMFP